VIRTKYSLISNGTESSFLRGERVAGDTPSRAGDKLPFPQVTGYQKVGIVERAPDNSPFRRGQWVQNTVSKVGLPEQPWGGHVSIAVAPAREIYALPEGLDPIEASGLVLTQVGFNCGARPEVATGATAVVIGDGLVGHWAAQTLQHRGARVVLLGKHRFRYSRFAARTDDRIVDLSAVENLDRAVAEACPDGIAVLVDTVGANDLVEQLVPRLRWNAHIVSAGFHGHAGRIDIQMLRFKEATLHCPAGWVRSRMEKTLALVAAGTLRVGPLITHRMNAAKAPEAFDMILKKNQDFLGILLEWEGEER
jgi:2-desacetyl-2-hydroxyethyl bacteriochlorophyllide A dehydrogenase